MTRRHANAAQDLAELLKHASPDVVTANTHHVAALRQDATAHPAAYRLTPAPAPCPTEHEEQVALFAWADANEAQRPELAMLVATPNGGYRPMATAVALKAEGVKAGYPDISLDVERGRFHGLRIELKRSDRSNHATPEQQAWIARLRHYGYQALICYGAEEAIAAIAAYLALDD